MNPPSLNGAQHAAPHGDPAVVTVARATITEVVSLVAELNTAIEELRAQVKKAGDERDE